MVVTFEEHTPRLAPGVWIHDTAQVIGRVVLGEDANVWPFCVLRGDVERIEIGARTNVQDHTVIHVTTDRWSTAVGEDVTIGHRVVLHGCRIGDRALVGIGAIVLDGAEVGEEALVGAGAVVTPGTTIPPRTLALGSPARPARELRDGELDHVRRSASHYVDLARRHQDRAGGA